MFDKNRVMTVVLPLRPHFGQTVKIARSGPRSDTVKTLQPAHRANLLRLDRALHSFSPAASSAELGEEEISAFLTHLARDGAVAASTQNQALSAPLLFYKEVLKRRSAGWEPGAR
jgi:hypothetical protein